MKDIRNIIIVLLMIIIGCLATCKSSRDKVIPDTVTITKIDTVYLDTTIIKEIPVPTPKIVYRDKPDTEAPVGTPDSLVYNLYQQDITDSLITGNITSVVDGTLKKVTLKYTPNFPKYINKETTITKTETIEKKVDKTSLALGLMLPITSDEFSPKILLSLSHKRFIYQVGYNPLNKFPEAGVSYKLW